MFHIVQNGDTKTYFAGWQNPVGSERREPLFSRRGCAFKFASVQLAVSYLKLFQSQSRVCSIVEMALDEKNRLTELPVDPSLHFEQSELRKLISCIRTESETRP